MGLLFYPKIRKIQSITSCFALKVFRYLAATAILCAGCSLLFVNHTFAQESLLDKRISLPKQHISLYNALNLISQKAECLFIYDSQIVENDKRVKLMADNQPLRLILDNILANPDLGYKVIGEHILIYKINKEIRIVKNNPLAIITPPSDSLKNIVIKGYIYDIENRTAVPYATIGILEDNIGTITNADGFFTLKIPASYSGASLVVSHMGYMNQRIPIQLIGEQKIDIYLTRRIISIQEVIIRYIDPNVIVEKAMEYRKFNNNTEPVYTTSFYREGVQKNDRYVSFSEAVFKVYKSAYTLSENFDQVKLLKSRKIENSVLKDTVFLKLKAGVMAALQLDIVKSVPDFLDQSEPSRYTYTYSDLISYNSQDAYAITFVQKEDVTDALYKGTMYIDKENYAILGADFEINPNYLDKAAENLILKKSKRLIVKLEKIKYSISYKPFGGKYYLNHIRCDLLLKTRFRNHLLSDNFSTFIEFATCKIDTLNVEKFEKREVLKPGIVFSDAYYTKDEAFWADYNIIAPEEKLSEALSRIIGKIERIE